MDEKKATTTTERSFRDLSPAHAEGVTGGFFTFFGRTVGAQSSVQKNDDGTYASVIQKMV